MRLVSKTIFLLLFFSYFMEFKAKANPLVQKITALHQTGNFLTAASIIKYEIEQGRISEELVSFLNVSLKEIGPIFYSNLSANVLENSLIFELKIIYAVKLLKNKEYEKAILVFDGLKNLIKDSVFALKIKLILGNTFFLLKNYSKALDYFNQCIVFGDGLSQVKELRKMGQYCFLARSRILYQQKKYEQNYQENLKIPMHYYYWPHMLKDQSWSAFRNENYNRSLGAVLSFKAPLLKKFDSIEAQYLRALSFFTLCYWEDASKISETLLSHYQEDFDASREFFKRNQEGESIFFKILENKAFENKIGNKFLDSLTNEVIHNQKYQKLIELIRLYKKELAYHQSLNDKSSETLLEVGYRSLMNIYGQELKIDFKNYLEKIAKMFGSLSMMKIYLLDKEKEILLSQKIDNVDKNDLESNVRIDSNEMYFSFNGEFWFDEFGYYNYKLVSQCKK